MSETIELPPSGPQKTEAVLSYQGDEVSKLLQMCARSLKIGQEIRFGGVGNEDILRLMVRMFNAELAAREAWRALEKILKIKELPELPETVQAEIMGAILRAKSNIQLSRKIV